MSVYIEDHGHPTFGDGGAMMTLGELDTAVRYNLPLLVLEMNDSAFGAEVQLLERLGLPDALARYENPSFEALAIAMGASGITVSQAEDIGVLRQRIGDLDGPLVADCKIKTERPDYLELLENISF